MRLNVCYSIEGILPPRFGCTRAAAKYVVGVLKLMMKDTRLFETTSYLSP